MDINTVAGYLQASLVSSGQERRAGENFVQQAAGQPGFAQVIVDLIRQETLGIHVRMGAAVVLKNMIRYRWSTSLVNEEDADDAEIVDHGPILCDQDKQFIKANILELAFTAPDRIKLILNESVRLISRDNFRQNWPELLPSLTQSIEANANNFTIVRGCLEIVAAVCDRYRDALATVELFDEIKYVLSIIGGTPLLELFQKTIQAVKSTGEVVQLLALLGLLKVIYSIFYSLNSQDIPEFYEDHINEWIVPSLELFSFSSPLLPTPSGDDDENTQASPLHEVLAAICENLTLYMSKYEEQFEPFLQNSVTVVWSVLMSLGESRLSTDLLATAAIRFLTVIAKSLHYGVFGGEGVLSNIVNSVIVPAMALRQSDEELFEDNPLEYIRTDWEGTDTDTRRYAASELLQGLCKHFSAQVSLLSNEIAAKLFAEYQNSNRQRWKDKDIALAVVSALAVYHADVNAGVSPAALSAMVDVNEIYQTHVLPEITMTKQAFPPILTASCLKFAVLFRNQLPVDSFPSIIPHLLTWATNEATVVHTYAAASIERFLTVRDKNPQTGEFVLRWGKSSICNNIESLLTVLFGIFSKDDSSENAWAMKCVMRVVSVAQELIAPFAQTLIDSLNKMLSEVCKNPKTPDFNHYLFESVATILKFITATNHSAIPAFEELLFPPFTSVLSLNVAEFIPYVFQILAAMLEAHMKYDKPPVSIPATYLQLFEPLLTPTLWTASSVGNIPPLVRLLRDFCAMDGSGLATQHLSGMLGIFQKLVASKASDHEGLSLLRGLCASVPADVISPHLGTIVQILLMRLQSTPTNKYRLHLVVTMGFLISHFGVELILSTMESMQVGLSPMVIGSIITILPKVQGSLSRKYACSGFSSLLCHPQFLAMPNVIPETWKIIVSNLVVCLASSATDNKRSNASDAKEASAEAAAESDGYSSQYSRLYYAQEDPIRDDLPNVSMDVHLEFVRSLHALSQQKPGAITHMVHEAVPAILQATFTGWFGAAGIQPPFLS